jgi:hypothetical protein
MGKQYNKEIKRKRRNSQIKRKKEVAKVKKATKSKAGIKAAAAAAKA